LGSVSFKRQFVVTGFPPKAHAPGTKGFVGWGAGAGARCLRPIEGESGAGVLVLRAGGLNSYEQISDGSK